MYWVVRDVTNPQPTTSQQFEVAVLQIQVNIGLDSIICMRILLAIIIVYSKQAVVINNRGRKECRDSWHGIFKFLTQFLRGRVDICDVEGRKQRHENRTGQSR